MEPAEFLTLLGGVFEHSPWVAERAWSARPFDSVHSLHGAMVHSMKAASEEQRMNLLCAHPELAGKEVRAGRLTASSTVEQASAGLDRLDDDELAQWAEFNSRYRSRFGFPFIMAVKSRSKEEILSSLRARLRNDAPVEVRTAMEEIGRITRFRLDALVRD